MPLLHDSMSQCYCQSFPSRPQTSNGATEALAISVRTSPVALASCHKCQAPYLLCALHTPAAAQCYLLTKEPYQLPKMAQVVEGSRTRWRRAPLWGNRVTQDQKREFMATA